MKTKIYGAYGSNINLEQMAHRCPNAKVIGKGKIEDYKLTFRRGGYANIEPSVGDSVPVLLWEITEFCEQSLDRYEGFPSFYEKQMVEVDGQKVMVYVMTKEMRGNVQLPSEYYYYGIMDGYADNKMPIEELKSALENCMDEVLGNG